MNLIHDPKTVAAIGREHLKINALAEVAAVFLMFVLRQAVQIAHNSGDILFVVIFKVLAIVIILGATGLAVSSIRLWWSLKKLERITAMIENGHEL